MGSVLRHILKRNLETCRESTYHYCTSCSLAVIEADFEASCRQGLMLQKEWTTTKWCPYRYSFMTAKHAPASQRHGGHTTARIPDRGIMIQCYAYSEKCTTVRSFALTKFLCELESRCQMIEPRVDYETLRDTSIPRTEDTTRNHSPSFRILCRGDVS